MARLGPGNPAYPFLASEPAANDGTLARWDWFVGPDFVTAVLPALLDAMDAADSRLLDLTSASAAQAMDRLGEPDRWLERQPPLVIAAGRRGQLRVGAFNWTTDRDAFVRKLLGDPVPVRPRYARTGPSEPVTLDGDLWSVQEGMGFRPGEASDLFGASREQAAQALESLAPVATRIAGADPGGEPVADAVFRTNPEAWSDSPVGRVLVPLARGAPRWRSPRVAAEWAAAFDLGVVGVHGVAMWSPGPYELRKHRRAMAAHLRYLFDYLVSPWSRLPSDHRQREALLLYWRRLAPLMDREPSVKQICASLRRKWPEAYRTEAADVTMRRLYRLSAWLDPARAQLRARAGYSEIKTPASPRWHRSRAPGGGTAASASCSHQSSPSPSSR